MKTIKALITLCIIVAVVWVGMKVVPVYFNYYQFQDAMGEEARIQSYTSKSEQDIRESMWKKAQEYDIPLTSQEQIVVVRSGNYVAISTKYTVHIDVPIHPFDLTFEPNSKNKAI